VKFLILGLLIVLPTFSYAAENFLSCERIKQELESKHQKVIRDYNNLNPASLHQRDEKMMLAALLLEYPKLINEFDDLCSQQDTLKINLNY
jgi:hypothetical protein